MKMFFLRRTWCRYLLLGGLLTILLVNYTRPTSQANLEKYEELSITAPSSFAVFTLARRSEFEQLMNLIASVQYWAPWTQTVVVDVNLTPEQLLILACLQHVVIVPHKHRPHVSAPSAVSIPFSSSPFPHSLEAAHQLLQEYKNLLYLNVNVEVRAPLLPIAQIIDRTGSFFISAPGSLADEMEVSEAFGPLPTHVFPNLEYLMKQRLCSLAVFGIQRGQSVVDDVFIPTISCSRLQVYGEDKGQRKGEAGSRSRSKVGQDGKKERKGAESEEVGEYFADRDAGNTSDTSKTGSPCVHHVSNHQVLFSALIHAGGYVCQDVFHYRMETNPLFFAAHPLSPSQPHSFIYRSLHGPYVFIPKLVWKDVGKCEGPKKTTGTAHRQVYCGASLFGGGGGGLLKIGNLTTDKEK